MSLNPTLNYLLEKFSVSVLPFSKTVTDESTYMAGAGGCAGDGFPLPTNGVILGLRAWDGSNNKSKSGSVSVSAGDRISIYLEHEESIFTAIVRVNELDTALTVTGLKENTDIYACIYLNLQLC
jgi:hypothetical protein